MFFVGALVGSWIWPNFVFILPGPKIDVVYRGLRATEGNAVGCTLYDIVLTTDDPLEYVYLKIQFPNQIEDYKAGLPIDVKDPKGDWSLHMWVVGKDDSGKFTLSGQDNLQTGGVQSSGVGNIIAISASKLPRESTIVGAVIVPNLTKHNAKMYTEGAYEYTKWGQIVRKVLPFSYKGTQDLIHHDDERR